MKGKFCIDRDVGSWYRKCYVVIGDSENSPSYLLCHHLENIQFLFLIVWSECPCLFGVSRILIERRSARDSIPLFFWWRIDFQLEIMTLRKWWVKVNISRSFDTTMDSRSSWTWTFPSSPCPTRPWCRRPWRVWTGMSSSLRSSTSRKRLELPRGTGRFENALSDVYEGRCPRGTAADVSRRRSLSLSVVAVFLTASAVRDGRLGRRRRWNWGGSAVRLSVTATETLTRRRATAWVSWGLGAQSSMSCFSNESRETCEACEDGIWLPLDTTSLRSRHRSSPRSLASSWSRRRGFPLTRRPRKPRMSSSCPLRRTCPRRLAVSHRSRRTRPNPCRSSKTCCFRWTSTQTRRVRAKGDALSAVSLKTKCHYNCNSNCCLLLILRISLLPQRLLLLRLLLLLLL